MVTVKNMTLTLEEELLLKALKFAGIARSDREMEILVIMAIFLHLRLWNA